MLTSHQAELESSNRTLAEENRQLRLENQLLRDHLLSAEAASSLASKESQGASLRDDAAIARQTAAIKDVEGQLERALRSVRGLARSGPNGGWTTDVATPVAMVNPSPHSFLPENVVLTCRNGSRPAGMAMDRRRLGIRLTRMPKPGISMKGTQIHLRLGQPTHPAAAVAAVEPPRTRLNRSTERDSLPSQRTRHALILHCRQRRSRTDSKIQPAPSAPALRIPTPIEPAPSTEGRH